MDREGVVQWLVGDHLGTTSLVLNANGTVHSEARHYPYGEERWRWPQEGTFPTDYRFTGQRNHAYIKLVHMGARFYDHALGRWQSPDSLVPNPDNPQDFNRYSYVQNSPLIYVDPTGHCTGLTGFSYDVCKAAVLAGKKVVDQLNQYREDIFFPGEGTTFAERLEACSVVGGGSVLIGAAGTELIAGTLTAAATTEGLVGTTAVTGGIWQLNPFERGRQIHQILGENLPSNFPTIDRFVKGVATSIKSIDLNASSYQNISRLTSTVTGYIDKLANWQGARWGNIGIGVHEITEKVLELAIPSSGWSQVQWDALMQLQEYAAELDVILKIVQVP